MFNIPSNYRKKFFIICTSIILIFLVIVFTLIFVYKTFLVTQVYDPSLQPDSTIMHKDDAFKSTNKKGFLTPPVRTNFLITGLDKEEHLTDVIMVGSFISTTGQINLMSIPRDTYTTFSGDLLKKLRNSNSGAPSIMKINSVYSYTARKSGIEILQSWIEETLGINIDYYVTINLDAFKKIVDTVGGIYFDVPKGGLKYSDPTQNLKINLKEGYQLLNGDQAEGLVRFRKGYPTQDLKRVEVQQEFIKEFVKQVLNKETIVSNLGGILVNIIRYVKTDFKITDFPKYIKSIDSINVDTIQNTTAPGNAQYINGGSYYLIDKNKLKEIVDSYFYGSTEITSEEEVSTTQVQIN